MTCSSSCHFVHCCFQMSLMFTLPLLNLQQQSPCCSQSIVSHKQVVINVILMSKHFVGHWPFYSLYGCISLCVENGLLISHHCTFSINMCLMEIHWSVQYRMGRAQFWRIYFFNWNTAMKLEKCSAENKANIQSNGHTLLVTLWQSK